METEAWEDYRESPAMHENVGLARRTGRPVPVNIYETDTDLVIAAPLPGIRPEDIEVTVTETMLTICSGARGDCQGTKRYIRHEWNYGPYTRTVNLPAAVDASRANATYGDGVLMLMIPKAAQTRTYRIKLSEIGPAHGESAGHGVAEFSPQTHTHVEERREDRSGSAS
jgi:HSP20 family protein